LSITFTNPEPVPSSTTARLLSFKANVDNREAAVVFEVGYIANNTFRVTRRISLLFSDINESANFTFTQLLQTVPEVRDLAGAMEQVALNAGIFNGALDP